MNLTNLRPITHTALPGGVGTVQTVMNSGLPARVSVKDINPGEGSSSAEMFVTFNGVVYFRANDGSHRIELWRTDGTPEGTSLVADLRPGVANAVPGEITIAGGSLFMRSRKRPARRFSRATAPRPERCCWSTQIPARPEALSVRPCQGTSSRSATSFCSLRRIGKRAMSCGEPMAQLPAHSV